MPTRLALVAAFFILMLSFAARAADPDLRTISTSGESIVYVVPDKVIINLGVETFNASLDEAKSANEAAASKLVKALLDMSIEKKDIATDNLQVDVRRRDTDDHYAEIRGYYVRRAYAITLRDVKQFEKLVDTALKNGCNVIHNISFTTTDLRKYRDQARQMAIKAAREKAVLLAKELDTGIGKPRTIAEGGGSIYFGGYRSNYNSMNSMSQNSWQSAPAQPDNGETLPLGQIAINATVSVTFDLQ